MELEAHRESLGLTQQQLADLLGLRSKGSISWIEDGNPVHLTRGLQIEDWSDGAVPAASLVTAEDRALLEGHDARLQRTSRLSPAPEGVAA